MIIYLILLTPLLLALTSYLTNKKHSNIILNIIFYVYTFIFFIILFLLKNNTLIENKYFILDFSKNLFINTNLLENINVLYFSLILLISSIVTKYSYYYLNKEIAHKVIGLSRLKEFNILINLFIFAMLMIASTKNIIVMWIALEATTIFTTFLISFYGTKSSWEASWKYVILCSVGLTIGLFGIILLISSGLISLDFTNINYENVNILGTKLAFGLILIGFGTKVGLFPMHTWLPDAHGKAATPVSAFMSGILLPLAIYIIIKIKIIVDIMLGSNVFTNNILMFFGLVTLLYAGFLMIFQKHFKRALAYSSSENMGIILIGFALATPLSIKFTILHITAHSFLKAASFMSVGNILIEQKTGQFKNISNIGKNMKTTSILMIISLLLLVGLPISPLFISEIGIIKILFDKNIILALLFVLAVILIFIGILKNFSKMFVDKKEKKTIFIKEKIILKSIFTPIIFSIFLGIMSICILFI